MVQQRHEAELRTCGPNPGTQEESQLSWIPTSESMDTRQPPSVTTVLVYPSKSDAAIINRWSGRREIERFYT